MPQSREDLIEAGKATRFKRGDPRTEDLREKAQEAKNAIRARRKNIRQLAQDLMLAKIKVPEKTIEQVRSMGITEFDGTPEFQHLLIAKLGMMALGDDPDLTLAVLEKILDLTGLDKASIMAAETRKIERERLQVEREKIAAAERLKGGPAVAEELPDDGFIKALGAAAEEVFPDGADGEAK